MLIFWGSVNCYIVRWILKYWSTRHQGDFVMIVVVIDCCISELCRHKTSQQHNSVGSGPLMLIFWGSVNCYIFRWLPRFWSTRHQGDFGMIVVVIDCCISELCRHKTSQQHNSVSSRPLMLIFWGSVNCYIFRWLLKYWSMKHWGDFGMTVIVIDCCISELSCHTTLQQHNSVGSCPMMLIFWGSVDCYIFRWLLKYWSTKHWGDFGMTVVAIDDCISNFENCYLVCCCELLLEGIFGIPLGGLGAQVWIFSRVSLPFAAGHFSNKNCVILEWRRNARKSMEEAWWMISQCRFWLSKKWTECPPTTRNPT